MVGVALLQGGTVVLSVLSRISFSKTRLPRSNPLIEQGSDSDNKKSLATPPGSLDIDLTFQPSHFIQLRLLCGEVAQLVRAPDS